ncbi:uncharacterized protein P174DRAFT_439475 [Aspergillus novofumigatus IBT 16806]|uniref:Uncharacterized protein n=1 Tax=Aspergillus novofumigatus (strain IBT 16806) TaxID=1392255 RepID=A0A2I1CJC9_ASPN1|nr:uncharacterized protein P174DRAFT_439475 [Aspergillus novofumigatus IBT 16806]PKX97731.1 hypothetical protein P174DRAFT_439475 [Aspergillus novofumigatus IBT 16806]
MPFFPDQASSQTCVCRGTVARTQRYLRSPSVDITLIVDLIEELTSSVQRSSRDNCGCLQLSEYVQVLLDTTDALCSIQDSAWKKTVLGTAPSPSATVKPRVPLSPDCGIEKKLDLPTITGFQHIVTVDRFILDAEERKLVLQEIFRGCLLSINRIVRNVHNLVIGSAQCNLWPLEEKKRMSVQSAILLERTYSALGRCGGFSESNV